MNNSRAQSLAFESSNSEEDMIQKLCSIGFAAMLAGSTIAVGATPAAAAPYRHHHGSGHHHTSYNHHDRHHHHYAYHGHRHYYWHHGHRYYGYGWAYDDNTGAAIAAGVFGAALGAMAAGAASDEGGVAYCEQHFRSYNPRTELYLGYDGRYHHCP
jgi:BA14K-like protein